MTTPLGKTIFGITVWAVPGKPGRHLSWGGPGDHVHLRKGARDIGGQTFLGDDKGTVAGPCQDLAAAQQAVDTWLADQAETSAEIRQQWIEEMDDR